MGQHWQVRSTDIDHVLHPHATSDLIFCPTPHHLNVHLLRCNNCAYAAHAEQVITASANIYYQKIEKKRDPRVSPSIPPKSEYDLIFVDDVAPSPSSARTTENYRGVPLAVTDVALNIVLSEAYDTVYGARPKRRWLEKMGKELVYRAGKNGGLVNAATGQKSGVLIELPNGPRNNAASGGEEAGDLDDEMEE
ncbi:hypothetical protein MRB53_004966 [Persea americana]|uniref:Uncharacterized protein n=1 Tax=Persea americana TaxID=3435 RepID=A0ACC2MCQ0_PERAE|nr:hypothetical protein MRB53_004966 [Persea americana]